MKTRSSVVLIIASLLPFACSGCASSVRRVLLPLHTAEVASDTDVDSLLQRYPLAADDNIRVAPVLSTAAMSTHLVQIRNTETPHRHVTHDVVVTMLRGKGTLHLDGEARCMQPGDVAVVPRDTVHFFVNEGGDPAAAFATFAPPYDGKDQVPAP